MSEATYRVLDDGNRCEVTAQGKTITLRAQPGYVYTEADRDRIIATAVRYMEGSGSEAPDEQIRRYSVLGREWIVRVDHSPPAWKWPKLMVNRQQRWVGAGWRMTLVQVYAPKRRQA